MLMALRDRHRYGAGAAACAACCAAPVLGLLGVAGAAATVATFLFAGVVFAIVVGVAALSAVVLQKRRARPSASATGCASDNGATSGPVTVTLSPARPADAP